MGKKKKSSSCAGRTSKGRVKKGYRVKRGQSCPVKVGK